MKDHFNKEILKRSQSMKTPGNERHNKSNKYSVESIINRLDYVENRTLGLEDNIRSFMIRT